MGGIASSDKHLLLRAALFELRVFLVELGSVDTRRAISGTCGLVSWLPPWRTRPQQRCYSGRDPCPIGSATKTSGTRVNPVWMNAVSHPDPTRVPTHCLSSPS